MKRSVPDLGTAVMLLVTTLIWAGSFIFAKLGLREIPPITFALLRFAIAFPVVTLFLTRQTNEFNTRTIRKDLISFTALALSGVTLNFVFQFYSLKFITATAGAIVINTSVVFMTVFSAVFLGETMTWRKVTGVLIAFLGTFIVISKGDWGIFGIESMEMIGYILMIAACICWAVYSILGKKVLEKYSPTFVTAVVFGLGTLYLVPFSIAELPWANLFGISLLGWFSVFYLAIPCSALAYVLWYEGIRRLDVTKAAVFLYAVPVLTLILSHVFLGEMITYAIVCGAVLVILGVHLTQTG